MIKRLVLPLLPGVCLGLILLSVEPPTGRAVAEPTDVIPLPPVSDPDGRLGVCYGFYEDPSASGERPFLDLMYNAGARHDRWDFSWWAIQPDSQDQWNWSGHERIVAAENAKGVDVLGILQCTAWLLDKNGVVLATTSSLITLIGGYFFGIKRKKT